VLTQLESLGADLTRPREVLHYLYFPAESSASEAAEAIVACGYRVAVKPAPQEASSWLVVATAEVTVDAESIEDARRTFEGIAAVGDGEYDGW
jgi:hypothetical protein